MRSFFKNFPTVAILATFLATSALADSMCYDLCVSCHGETRAENCDKIESTCNCPFVIDSAKSKNMGVELGKRKLTEAILAGCDKAACARSITFENGYYKSMDKGRTTLTKFQLLSGTSDASERALKMQPQAIRAANATVDSLQRRRSLLPIAPMSQECTDRCNTCALAAQPAGDVILIEQEPEIATPPDSAALAKAHADSIARADSAAKAEAELKAFCQLAESSCQCKAHEQNTRDIIAIDKEIAEKTAYADSLLKFRTKLLREEMARAIADSVQAHCNVEGKCSYTVTFTSAEFAILEMHPTEEPKPVAAAAPADTAKAAPAVEQAPASAPADTTAAQPAPAACPQAAESAPADSTKKKDRIFYKVMEFTYGNFGEHSYYQKGYGRIRNLDDETGYEGGLTYYLRWYFYDGGAFSIGMGTFYHYKKFTLEDTLALTDKVDIYYHNIGLDIPISFRLGVPYIPIFKPFISQTFNFHKPIFEIYKVEAPESEKELSKEEEVKEAAKDQLGLGFLDDIETRFNGVKDLTFSVWLGIGLQITRHFSAEYQFNFGVGGSGHSHRFDTDNYWRIVVDFAW
jgi:cell division septation protein DedD